MIASDKYSTITIRENNKSKKVRITSDLNPEIQTDLIEKWQALIDTVAKIENVPSGLIMKLNEENIEVFVKSNTEGNPYELGETAPLIYGLYCETVIGNQEELIVADATKSVVWKDNNPDIDLNMISYLGYPICWPSGVVFGTVCLLDSKENHYTEDFQKLLLQVKQHIETDLQLLSLNAELIEKNKLLTQLNGTKSRFLSLISHDVRGGVGFVNELLKLIIEHYDIYEKSELQEMLAELSESANSSFITLENLLMWSKNDLVQIEPDKKPINIIDVLNELLNSFKQEFLLKSLKLNTEFYSNEAFVEADKDMIVIIFRNLISNAIKYTKEGGELSLKVNLVNKKHIIEIEDTGIGMDANAVKKLFTYDKSHNIQGTKGESSAGIGLMLVKEFIDKHQAEVAVESILGLGTKVKIIWP